MKRFPAPWALLPAVLALTAGLVLLAFPRWNLSGLAWVCLVPLCLYTWTRPAPKPFWIGWAAGTLSFYILIQWLLIRFPASQEYWWVTGKGMLLTLSASMGLAWGLWLWVTTSLWRRCRERSAGWSLVGVPLASAASWTALEFLRTYMFLDYPAGFLGTAFYRQTALIQVASLTGVYGISFLVAWWNTALAVALLPNQFSAKAGSGLTSRFQAVLILLVVVGIAWGWGHTRLKVREADSPTLRVALLQGDLYNTDTWDDRQDGKVRQTYAQLLKQASPSNPQLIVWPETAVRGYVQNRQVSAWLLDQVRQSKAIHLIGTPLRHDRLTFNGVMSIDPTGNLLGEYRKMRLVPIGETVPRFLSRYFRTLNTLGSITPGERAELLPIPGGLAAMTICYESLFPGLVRDAVAQGGQLIVNVSDDGFFAGSSQSQQHLAYTVFRAVENDRWLVRANNRGLSTFVDPRGRIVSVTPELPATVLEGLVTLKNSVTIYNRIGDLFIALCLFGVVLFAWLSRRP